MHFTYFPINPNSLSIVTEQSKSNKIQQLPLLSMELGLINDTMKCVETFTDWCLYLVHVSLDSNKVRMDLTGLLFLRIFFLITNLPLPKEFLERREVSHQGKKEFACIVSKHLVPCLWGFGKSVNPPGGSGGFSVL